MFLQYWIADRIKQIARKEYPEYKIIDDSGELTRQDIESFQLLRLRKTLDYVCQKSSFYQELLSRAGVKPDAIRSREDLARIPFTTSSDLAQNPWGFLCIKLGEVERTYTLSSSGTTGEPKKIFFTDEELDDITDYMGAAMKTVAMLGGAGESQYKVYIMLPDGKKASQARLLAEGVEEHNGKPVQADISLGTEEQIQAIEKARPHILFGSVSRLRRMTQEGRLGHDLGQLGVKIIFLTSEYLPLAIRKEIEKVWGGEVYFHYGMTEMGFGGAIECSAHNGFHFNEADFLFEVVNPVTGELVKDGEEGELVFSTLSRQGMPLIRYRSGDLTCLISEPCACGASVLQKLGKVSRRIDDGVKIGSDIFYPSLFDDVLYPIPGLIDYRVFITGEDNKDLITCKVELNTEHVDIDRIISTILSIPSLSQGVKSGLIAEPRVEMAKSGELRRTGRGKQHLIDNRSE